MSSILLFPGCCSVLHGLCGGGSSKMCGDGPGARVLKVDASPLDSLSSFGLEFPLLVSPATSYPPIKNKVRYQILLVPPAAHPDGLAQVNSVSTQGHGCPGALAPGLLVSGLDLTVAAHRSFPSDSGGPLHHPLNLTFQTVSLAF